MRSEWNVVPLRELVAFISKGIAPSYAERETNTTIRVLNQKCNRNFQISYSESRLHDLAKKHVPTERYVQQDDILINSTGVGTAGRIAQINEVPCKTTVDGHMIIIRANKRVTQRYLGYALKAHQREVLLLDEGSTGQTELNRERLLDEIMISYPESLPMQEEIVLILQSIEQKMIVNNQVNDNLQQQAETNFQSWFTDGKEINGCLADICQYSKEKVVVSSLDLDSYYSTENMLPGKAGATQAANLPTTTQTTKCNAGDVLVSNIRPYFKKIVYCYSDCGCSTDVLCFVPKKQELSAYLFFLVYADAFFDFMVAGSKGTKMPRGDKQQIMVYPVYVPSGEELARFNSITQSVLKQIQLNREENKRLIALRDTLLPKLMAGEIDLQEV